MIRKDLTVEQVTNNVLAEVVERTAWEAKSQFLNACFLEGYHEDLLSDLAYQIFDEPDPTDYGDDDVAYNQAMNEADELVDETIHSDALIISKKEFALLVALEVARQLAREV